jgi:hypothetical protein
MLITLIKAIPLYLPSNVTISQDLQISGTATSVAIDGEDMYYFADGDSGRGIYKLSGTTREFITALDKIDGLAVNSTQIFYGTVGTNQYGTIVILDKTTHAKIAETVNIRYIKGIVADDDYLYFQGCLDNQNICNSVSAINLSLVVDEVIKVDDELDDNDVSPFRLFKRDLLNAPDPIVFANKFSRITNDPNNPKVLYIYKSTELTGKTLVYLASVNTDTATKALYPLIVESVDLFDNTTGNKIIATTDNEISFRLSANDFLTRIRNFNRVVGTEKVNKYYISIFKSLVETKVYREINYTDNFENLTETQMFFEYATPFSFDGQTVVYIGNKWEKTATSATMETKQSLHLEDVLLSYDVVEETLNILYTTEDKERIIGYANGTVYLYKNLKIIALDLETNVRQEIHKVRRFSAGTAILIDFSSDFIAFYTADFKFFERIEL